MFKKACSAILLVFGSFFLMMGGMSQSSAKPYQVNADDYSSFWIWGRISSASYLSKAKELYILQGEIRLDPYSLKSKVTPQGVSVLNIPHQKVWLVFRNHHLNWENAELTTILDRARQWENKGNQIVGIQIDYDSHTKDLKNYALFIQEVRKQLPQKYKLSVTGLMDWTNHQDIGTLKLLQQNLNEMVIQTYQGSTTIHNYQAYLKKIPALQIPYKVGIVQHGHWDKNIILNQDQNFKGYVVFLLR